MSQWALAEFLCPVHGRFEKIIERPVPDWTACVERDVDGSICYEESEWVVSAPKTKKDSIPCYATVRGGDSERRPGMLDTRPLAEGQSMKEWKATQDRARQERRHHQLIKKGLKVPKVQVG